MDMERLCRKIVWKVIAHHGNLLVRGLVIESMAT